MSLSLQEKAIKNGKHVANEALFIADEKADPCPINPNVSRLFVQYIVLYISQKCLL
jgi:hypothetical protein